MITVLDYGMGNIASIINMLRKLGAAAEVGRSPADIDRGDKIILPGVGAFDSGMANLRERDLVGPLERKALEEGVPVLGICLGMQLLTRGSEEGSSAGLGWLPAETVRLGTEERVPHMGWNTVLPERANPLLVGFSEDPRFYFVHSYRVEADVDDVVWGTTVYGRSFVSVIGSGNVYGTQFHPEKSHRYGMQLLRNFAQVTPS